jgi:electron transfer flavoprotein alpha subunit
MSVLVYLENWDGKFKKLSFELASYAARIAGLLNTKPVALSVGPVETSELEKIAGYGISRIISVTNPELSVLDNQVFTEVISALAEKEEASVVVLSHNNTGKALAGRLAVRLNAAVGAGVSHLPLSVEPFVVYKRVFSGNAFAHVELMTPVKILTLSQNSFELMPDPVAPAVDKIQVPIDASHLKTRVTNVQKQTGKILLTDAEIVISGGRGMKSPDNWGPLVELAELLGGATACSRPVSDEGWRPHEEHTGQTGKIIAPNLYFAIGISGSTQHLAGVSSSKIIVAVNTDKDAPIFEAAQYGIVGDAQKILPRLVEAVREMKHK